MKDKGKKLKKQKQLCTQPDKIIYHHSHANFCKVEFFPIMVSNSTFFYHTEINN